MNIGFLLAAGKSQRFGSDKNFILLEGRPIIWHSLKFLHDSPYVDSIVVAAHSGNKKKIAKLVQDEKFSKVKKIILGGKTRFESVKKCLTGVHSYNLQHTSYLLIHNSANPHAAQSELYQCVNTLKRYSGASGVGVGRPIFSTIKNAPGGKVRNTLQRENLWEMETPQVVRAKDFLEAVRLQGKRDFTDDLAVLEAARMETRVILASPRNRKITMKEDLPVSYIVGIGEDSHRFEITELRNYGITNKSQISNARNKKNLILGGIAIKEMPRLEAESDGDVILHALCNAIASAIGKGSLGTYATRMAKQGIRDSKKYLQVIQHAMKRQHRSICHCSISIEASKPKIDPLAPRLKKSLSKILKISEDRIGITATSGEKLTPFGKGEAIRCQVAVLLQ